MARLKMSRWDSVIEDCEECLRLSSGSQSTANNGTSSSSSGTSGGGGACPYANSGGPKPASHPPTAASRNFKALYYLSQAHLPLKNYDQAVDYALKAHKICAETHDKSLPAVTAQVLKCKKERWEHREKIRRREEQGLEEEVVDLLRHELENLKRSMDEGYGTNEEERKETEKMYEDKIARIRAVFERARSKDEQKRENPPDWAVDDISFQVMVDPVMVSFFFSFLHSLSLFCRICLAW